MKTNPDHDVYLRAMDSRAGALQVICRRPGRKAIVSRGSGFIINDRCRMPLALTCNHVVRGDRYRVGDVVSVRRVMPAGVQEFRASVLETDSGRDIALLGIPGLRSHAPMSRSLTLATIGMDNVGDCAIAVGYCNPLLLFPYTVYSRLPAVSPGCIRNIRRGNARAGHTEHEQLLLDCTATKGMSGSPVVARNGAIAMCTEITPGGRRTIAVSSRTILQVLSGWANNDHTSHQGLLDLI